MATYFARKAGNINASDVWATTPSGTAAAVTFANGDVLMANSFAIAVNVSTNLGALGEVRNDTFGGATAGGGFTLSNGVTLTANCFAGSFGNSVCVTFSGTSGNSATIVGNCIGGSGSNAFAANNTSSGTLNIVGNCTTGTFASCAVNSAGGTLNITGNCTGGSTSTGTIHAANNSFSGALNITGNCTGGSVATNSYAANNNSLGVLNITGNCTGGSASPGAFNNSTGTMVISGAIQASEFVAGVGGTNRQQVTLFTGPFLISPTLGVNPIGCTAWRWASALNDQTYLEVATQTLLQKRNLVTPDNATNFPSASDVRSGTAYGIGGVVSGTCIVPSPAQVAAGTPVDNTVGTLASATAGEIATAVRSELSVELGRLDASISSRLAPSGTLATVTNLTNAPASVTPSDIWSHATRTITGGTVTTLTNAPTVPSAASIRAEIDSNSTQLAAIKAKTDLLPASPAATGDIPSANISAIKAKTDLLETTRLAQCSTVSTTGAQLAAALS